MVKVISDGFSGDDGVFLVLDPNGRPLRVPGVVLVDPGGNAVGSGQPAISVAATGTVTSTGVTLTSDTVVNGMATFAAGTATIPFKPAIGFPVRLLLIPSNGAAFTAFMATSTDGGAPNALTAGGSAMSYTTAVNEFVDVPPTTAAGLIYDLVIMVTSGSVGFAMRN